jgi:O-6-methylguanine DNA methyltransferase
MRRDAAFLGPWAGQLVAHLGGRLQKLDVPLDIQATAFQRRVWEYLQTIPYGGTKSYGEIAKAIRAPKAARAVARACAANPVAVVIPCHRWCGAMARRADIAGEWSANARCCGWNGSAPEFLLTAGIGIDTIPLCRLCLKPICLPGRWSC